jgi:lipopolysaccharide transport system ATP-binding protein
MPEFALRAENLGKAYQIPPRPAPRTLRDAASGWGRRRRDGGAQLFWALQDVSFDLRPGESLGVVGRNGAGKSTLLKVLSRITEPSAGRAVVRGRVASLLEVGAGFHPELTGRENIFLNAAILGMTRAETASRFDAIVAFAEVERFLETPVKHFSSGMYVRLAFAVAAHLEPDVLIVDEALAVGDAAFQTKCLGRMNALAAAEGRTVVFVSHNTKAVLDLCGEAIWLERGRVAARGAPRDVLARYLCESASSGEWRPSPGTQTGAFAYSRIAVASANGGPPQYDEPVAVELDYEVRSVLPPNRLSFLISTAEGQGVLCSSDTDEHPAATRSVPAGRFEARIAIPARLLAPGDYLLTVSEPQVDGSNRLHADIVAFTVSERGSPTTRGSYPGVVAPILSWNTDHAPLCNNA